MDGTSIELASGDRPRADVQDHSLQEKRKEQRRCVVVGRIRVEEKLPVADGKASVRSELVLFGRAIEKRNWVIMNGSWTGVELVVVVEYPMESHGEPSHRFQPLQMIW